MNTKYVPNLGLSRFVLVGVHKECRPLLCSKKMLRQAQISDDRGTILLLVDLKNIFLAVVVAKTIGFSLVVTNLFCS